MFHEDFLSFNALKALTSPELAGKIKTSKPGELPNYVGCTVFFISPAELATYFHQDALAPWGENIESLGWSTNIDSGNFYHTHEVQHDKLPVRRRIFFRGGKTGEAASEIIFQYLMNNEYLRTEHALNVLQQRKDRLRENGMIAVPAPEPKTSWLDLNDKTEEGKEQEANADEASTSAATAPNPAPNPVADKDEQKPEAANGSIDKPESSRQATSSKAEAPSNKISCDVAVKPAEQAEVQKSPSTTKKVSKTIKKDIKAKTMAEKKEKTTPAPQASSAEAASERRHSTRTVQQATKASPEKKKNATSAPRKVVSKEDAEAAASKEKHIMCRKCTNHGVEARFKGHTDCPNNDCDCPDCQRVDRARSHSHKWRVNMGMAKTKKRQEYKDSLKKEEIAKK